MYVQNTYKSTVDENRLLESMKRLCHRTAEIATTSNYLPHDPMKDSQCNGEAQVQVIRTITVSNQPKFARQERNTLAAART